MKKEWQYFKEGKWTKEINVSDFIKKNYKYGVADKNGKIILNTIFDELYMQP